MNNNYSNTNKATGKNICSFSLKVAAILCLAFSAPRLSAQIAASQMPLSSYSMMEPQSKLNTITKSVSEKTYTLYEAQNFPIIEAPAHSVLVAMEEHEHFDYEVIFCSARTKKKDQVLNSLPDPSVHKIAKNKIAPKLNS